MVQRRRFVTVAVLTAGLALVACGGGDEGSAAETTASTASVTTETATTPETTEVADPTTTVAPTTTEAPTTTAAPTTEAPTTTVALTAADLDLGAAAIGPVGFGTGVEPALAVLMPLLGTPATDDSHEYPTAMEGVGWTDPDEGIFAFQYLRRVCFDDGLCTSFGGTTPAELQLVGYDYYSAETPIEPALTTVNGVGLGDRWSDHLDAMTANEGGCYSQGSGESGGALLSLISDGDPFLVVDQVTGEATSQVPDPSMVTVYGIFAGDNPGYLYDDC
jgi:hypothetical protein